MKLKSLFLLSVFAFVACLPQPESNTSPIPPVFVSCHPAQHPECISQKSGRRLYVGLKSGEIDCRGLLSSQMPHEQIYEKFDATGFNLIQAKGAFLIGTVNQWYNFGNIRVYEVTEVEHTACAFIDLNDDARWSANVPLSQVAVEPGSEDVSMDVWY